ncbi:MAG: phage major capsid protein [Patescibacteria group bacterium]
MTPDEIRAAIAEKGEQKRALLRRIDKAPVEELRAINIGLENLNAEIADLQQQLAESEAQRTPGGPVGRMQILGTYGIHPAAGNVAGTGAMREEFRAALEEKGKALLERRAVIFTPEEIAEARSITIATTGIVTGKAVDPTIAPAPQQVSALIDMVDAPTMIGAESFAKPFLVSVGEGDYTGEGLDAAEAEPTFGSVTIQKAKVTAYAEFSEEMRKLSPIDYAVAIIGGVREAVRKKLGRQIVVGSGGVNALVGIYNAPEAVIPAASDLEIGTVDSETLNKLIFGFGGDEAVEGEEAVLILNKLDLKALADLYGNDGRNLYDIQYAGATGFITNRGGGGMKIRYVINGACGVLSDPATVAGAKTMLFGYAKAYTLCQFSGLEVQESSEYLFKKGMIAVRAVAMVGGNTARYKGFVRVKKAA